jgi:predicted secreted protein
MFVGQKFEIYNQSSGGNITLNFNGGAAFTDAAGTSYSSIASGTSLVIKLQTNSTSAGTWFVSAQAASSGSGGINYISSNPNAEAGTSGWALYNNAAQNIPNSSTSNSGGGNAGSGSKASGGTAANLTFAASSSSPLVGAKSFLLTKSAANAQGEGVSFPFTIDSGYQSQGLGISFNFNASSGLAVSNGYTAPLNDGTTSTNAGNSDVEVFVIDVTNNSISYVSPQYITSNGAGNYTYHPPAAVFIA